MDVTSAALGELLHLRALFEQYAAVDCWCGYSFEDVVATYVRDPTDPSDPEFREYAEREYPALEKSVRLTPNEREAGLVAEIKHVLSEATNEPARREILTKAGGETALEFSEFWQPTGDACEFPGRATLFLVLLRRYASEARTQTDPFNAERRKAILAEAENEAARLI